MKGRFDLRAAREAPALACKRATPSASCTTPITIRINEAATNLTAFAVPWPEWGNLFADFYFVPATDCASASLHWSLTLPILFRMQLLSLPGQLSFTSVVQALLISATRASLALHASENSAACVFTQSLMRPPPGLTSAHFALMSAAQTPTDRAIATGGERSTTAPITMILFIIGHSPKRKKMRMSSLTWPA